MLTTSLDGLWVLQVLAGIEAIAPELGLRPHLPSSETRDMVCGLPIAAELRRAGVLTAHWDVDEVVREWLTVLAQRDVALLMRVNSPALTGPPRQVLLARFDRWWVALEKCGEVVRISGMGCARGEQTAARLISAQLDRFCGRMPPVALRPVTLDVDEILEQVSDGESLRCYLFRRKLDFEQVNALMQASDRQRSAQASLVAVQWGVSGAPCRTHIAPGAVTIIDTPEGRLLSEQTVRDGRNWMMLRPGSSDAIDRAVRKMLRCLPADEEWFSHRKAL